jgi:hypothetical protein
MQNSLAMFVWTLDPMLGNGDMGAAQYYISSSRTISSDIRFRAGATTTDSVTSPTGLEVAGFIGFSRTSSANYVPYYNGTAQATVTRASAVPTADTLWLAGYKSLTSTAQQSSPRRNAVAIVANGLSGAQVGNLYARLNTFLSSVGTI